MSRGFLEARTQAELESIQARHDIVYHITVSADGQTISIKALHEEVTATSKVIENLIEGLKRALVVAKERRG